MRPSRNALRSQCWVGFDPGCWISGTREAEQVLRAARYGKQSLSESPAVLAIPPTLGGPK